MKRRGWRPGAQIALAMVIVSGVLLAGSPAAAHADVATRGAETARASATGSDDLLTLGDADDLGDALIDSTEAQLDDLLELTDPQAEPFAAVGNEAGQVLGVVGEPGIEQESLLREVLAPVLAANAGISLRSVDFVAADLDLLLLTIMRDRVSAGERLIVEKLGAVTAANSQMELLHAALDSLRAYQSSPSDASLAATKREVRAAGVVDSAWGESAGDAAKTAENLIAELKGRLDELANRQQLDMLQIQTLISKNNEAMSMLSTLVKRAKESSTSIVGSMRSKPVSLGAAEWDNGAVTGKFDLSDVPDGEHHLILDFADAGLTLVASVDVEQGKVAGVDPLWVAGGAALLVGLAVCGVMLLRRRAPRG